MSYKADVEWHVPGGAPGGTIAGVEEDEDREALAALEADPVREPLAEGGGIDALSGPHTVSYDNDAINRRSMTDSNLGIPINFARNALNQYTSVTGHGSLNYDANLNVSGYDGWAFVHDAEKRLVSVTGNGHSAQFVYDGLGRCVKRTIDGATVVITYDNWKPIVEWEWHAGAARLLAWNLYGPGADEILVRNQPNTGGYLYYHLDPMGNVQFLLSGIQKGLEKYTYDVFGHPTIKGWNGDVRTTSAYGNRFLFTGREYLYTFGLYDYRHRIYHPGLGRFIETDPLGQQIEGTKLSAEQTALYALGGTAPEKFSSSELNLYRYCHNDPVYKSDPFGLLDFEIQGNAEFKATMRAELAMIDSKPAGHAYLNELRASSFQQIIAPSKAISSTTQALDGAGSRNGKGAGSIYRINPSIKESGKDSTGKNERPGFIGVGHEIAGHGIENARGQSLPRALDNSIDKIPRSEKAAVQRENEIRKEHGIPERVNFYKKWKE